MTVGCRCLNSPELKSASTMFERLIGRLSTEQQIGADCQTRQDPPPTARLNAAWVVTYVRKLTKVVHWGRRTANPLLCRRLGTGLRRGSLGAESW